MTNEAAILVDERLHGMRDYKNVKVPKKYRTTANRVSVKRVDTGRGGARTEKSRAELKPFLVNVVAGICVVAGSWLAWQAYGLITHAELFQIAGIDVTGVRQLGKADLEKIAGTFTGQNIFRVDLEAAARRARANPWVKEIRIYRRLPNRISMSVVERIPDAVLDTGSKRYLMDSEAIIIEELAQEGAPAWPLPVIEVKDCTALPGEPVAAEGVPEALTLLAEISSRGGWWLSHVRVKANSPETLSVIYASHEFKIGSGNYAEKLRRLSEVMADVKQRGLNIAYVDLRPERQAAAMVVENKRSTKVSTKYKVQSTKDKKKTRR